MVSLFSEIVGRLIPAHAGKTGVIGHYVLLLARLFGFLVRESRYFSWLGPTMRMDKSCCW